ncbi:MAG: DNA-directed RNA polymerase subunit D [Candidatus Diapherotrites archaeon]|nr:DNA-directed RNA polymerase subunit D [Candidatus Diapherotrites archaeon]
MARNVIKVLSEKGSRTQLLVKGTNLATMNALRRIIMSEVPTLAIEELSIYENNGVLFDEFIGHRLGLVPISMDPKSYKLGDKVKMTLEAEGPCTVYSGDIKILDEGIQVLDKKIPLAKLKADQHIRLEGECVVGVGKDHVKYQPAIVGYRMLPLFTINENISPEMGEKLVKSCPVNIIEMKGKKISITEPSDCTLCGHCEEVGGAGIIQVDPDESGFVMTMEGTGALSTRQLVEEAISIMESKAKDFADRVKDGL